MERSPAAQLEAVIGHKMMNIRQVNPDKNEWARMRNKLWPSSLEDHRRDMGKYLSGETTDMVEVFVLEKTSDALGGFIKLNIRNYAEGSNAKNTICRRLVP